MAVYDQPEEQKTMITSLDVGQSFTIIAASYYTEIKITDDSTGQPITTPPGEFGGDFGPDFGGGA